MIGTGNRLKTDLVIFSINFGISFIINTLISQYDFFMMGLIFLIFVLTSFGMGPLFRAFKKSYVKDYRKYLYWFYQIILIACIAHILAFTFYMGQPNYLDTLITMLIYGRILIVLCYTIALVSVLILLRMKKKVNKK